jgi:hypothetical protein
VEMEERIMDELKIKKRKKGVMPAMMKQKINNNVSCIQKVLERREE